MSHGKGKGKGKVSMKRLIEKDSQEPERKKLALDEFSQALARIAVVQVCKSLGFQSFQQSALDTLADVAVRYISQIGKTTCLHSNLANRSQSNVFDVILGLEDLGSIQGFSGASDVSHSISGSGIVKDIIRYVGKAKKVPFAYYLIPVSPNGKKRSLDHNFARVEENSYNGHIPNWLPKFPNPESYRDVSLEKDKYIETMPVGEIQWVEEEHRKEEMPVQNMNGYKSVAVEHVGAAQAKDAAESNPYLAPPIYSENTEASLPTLPMELLEGDALYHQNYKVKESNISTLNPFQKTNGIWKSNPCECEDQSKIVLSGRPIIHFKVGNDKKHWSRVTSPQNVGIANLSP